MLILVRHGESTGNAAGLLAGHVDLPLTGRGLDQARSVGDSLQGVTRLVSSPLGRARDTAEALGLGLPVEIDERWIEVDYGEYDGRPLGEVPDEVWREWRADPHFRPPGGETLAEVGTRVRAACEELFAADGRGARGEGDVVVVSHVSPIKAATCWALGLPDEGAWRLYLATASVTRIARGPGGIALRGFNATPWSGEAPPPPVRPAGR
jgi:probable phosphoglycerate mutase